LAAVLVQSGSLSQDELRVIRDRKTFDNAAEFFRNKISEGQQESSPSERRRVTSFMRAKNMFQDAIDQQKGDLKLPMPPLRDQEEEAESVLDEAPIDNFRESVGETATILEAGTEGAEEEPLNDLGGFL